MGVYFVELNYIDPQKIASNFTVINGVHCFQGMNTPSVEMKIANDLKILHGYIRSVYVALVYWHQICKMSI